MFDNGLGELEIQVMQTLRIRKDALASHNGSISSPVEPTQFPIISINWHMPIGNSRVGLGYGLFNEILVFFEDVFC